MRTTTYDIAEACGVSQATVDRALNNRSGICFETKQRILKTALEMGYRPNNLPQYLKTGKTNIIGIILPDAVFFYAQLINHLTRILKALGYHTCISFSNFNIEQEKEYLAEFLKMNVDGIILFPINEDGSEIRKIINVGTPVVTIVRKIKNYNFDFVSINYTKITEQAIQYLLDQNHHHICYYTIWDDSSNYYTYKQRLKGYENALKKRNIPYNPRYVVKDTNCYQKARELLQNKPRPTAFYCFNELTAISLISYLNEIGLKVPDDLSVISFDDTDVLRFFSPGLTSIAYPYEDMCKKAVEILLNKLKNPSDDTRSEYWMHISFTGKAVKTMTNM